MNALAQGALITVPFHGRVTAVFDHAVNIEPAGDSLIVALVTRRAGMSARAVLVPWLPNGIEPGAAVEAFERKIYVYRTDGGVAAVVDLGRARMFDGRFAPAGQYGKRVSGERPAREARQNTGPGGALLDSSVVAELRDALDRHGSRDGLAVLLDDPGGSPVGAYAARALERGEPERLIGLGSGLTPAGDDFLTGVLAAEELLGVYAGGDGSVTSGGSAGGDGSVTSDGSAGGDGSVTSDGSAAIDVSASAVHRARLKEMLGKPGSTTDVSRTQLLLALRGHFPEYLLRVLLSLGEVTSTSNTPGENGRREEAVSTLRGTLRDACSYGHSSGTDTLVGLLWCFERLAGETPRRL